MTPEMWAPLGVVLSALIALAGGAYAHYSARRSTEQATAAALSDDLLGRFDKRVSDLEKKVEQLEGQVRTLDAVARAFSLFVDRIGLWVERGAPPGSRPKPPEVLHEYIDLAPWS